MWRLAKPASARRKESTANIRFPPIAGISVTAHHQVMDEEDTCHCAEHGPQPATYVCKHITGVAIGDSVGFVSGEPEGDDDLRDAWCDGCHSYLLAHGGDWLEETVEVPGGIDILCAECYRRREADAAKAGRRRIYQR